MVPRAMRDALNPILPAARWTPEASSLLAHALVEQAGELRRWLYDTPSGGVSPRRVDWVADEIDRLESAARIIAGERP